MKRLLLILLLSHATAVAAPPAINHTPTGRRIARAADGQAVADELAEAEFDEPYFNDPTVIGLPNAVLRGNSSGRFEAATAGDDFIVGSPIVLKHADGTEDYYAATNAGFQAAVTAFASGDVIHGYDHVTITTVLTKSLVIDMHGNTITGDHAGEGVWKDNGVARTLTLYNATLECDNQDKLITSHNDSVVTLHNVYVNGDTFTDGNGDFYLLNGTHVVGTDSSGGTIYVDASARVDSIIAGVLTPLSGFGATTPTTTGLSLLSAANAAAGRSAISAIASTDIDTSAELRAILGDEVGTGAAYFVGGALGTPASGTLSSCTGLPISTGVSGLATGVATALAATPNLTNGVVVLGANGLISLNGQAQILSGAANQITLRPNNSSSNDFEFASGGIFSLLNNAAGIRFGVAADLRVNRETSAVLQLGDDAAGTTDYTIKGNDRITSDGVGGSVTIAGGRNRGASAGGAVIIQASPATTAGNAGTLAEVARFDAANGISVNKTITAGGTTGNQTINKTAGSVNFSSAQTSVTVTNSLVTANSVVIVTVATNSGDFANFGPLEISQTTGSFTIYATAAPSVETRVNFIVIN